MSKQVLPKAKKSVALSGTVAGNTAICTVGRTGNDLHYRGYNILDIAEVCEFEEIAHLLVHNKLPTKSELAAYKRKLRSLRGLPGAVRQALEALPASAHPMDVMRTGCSVLGCCLPEKDEHAEAEARNIIDRLVASFGSMLLYWYHFSVNGKRIDVETDDDSVGGHFLHLLHGEKPGESWVRAMHTSLNLYAEHEFNASTFTGRVVAGTNSDIARRREPERLSIGDHGRDRRTTWSQARRCERRGVSYSEPLRQRRRGRRGYPRKGRPQRDRYRFRAPRLYDRRSAERRHQGCGAQAR